MAAVVFEAWQHAGIKTGLQGWVETNGICVCGSVTARQSFVPVIAVLHALGTDNKKAAERPLSCLES